MASLTWTTTMKVAAFAAVLALAATVTEARPLPLPRDPRFQFKRSVGGETDPFVRWKQEYAERHARHLLKRDVKLSIPATLEEAIRRLSSGADVDVGRHGTSAAASSPVPTGTGTIGGKVRATPTGRSHPKAPEALGDGVQRRAGAAALAGSRGGAAGDSTVEDDDDLRFSGNKAYHVHVASRARDLSADRRDRAPAESFYEETDGATTTTTGDARTGPPSFGDPPQQGSPESVADDARFAGNKAFLLFRSVHPGKVPGSARGPRLEH